MLLENTLWYGVVDKVQVAVDRLKQFEPEEGYWIAFSGGKDSMVILDLAKKAGVKYEAHYRIGGFDPPELVRFINQHYHDVIKDYPKVSQWLVMSKRGPANRRMRWCCDHKESGGKGRLVVTGVRWEESARRGKRKMVEQCYRDNSKRLLNLIIDWTEQEVWQYIKQNNLPYCSLYDEGFTRIGCVMCPLTSVANRIKEAERWPAYARNYLKMCEMAFDRKKPLGHKMPEEWKSGVDMYNWWVYDDGRGEKIDPNQTVIYE
ncbi:phosphoadenosine phosphosulfate reductase [Anaerospora hongkongensis]|uniref:Phosphoadenosine phosphosulfate reductase n=1 Tax=Anaerospora hongkongensis TaxID=244830 RepID=A0A4R1Q3E4_9FIRM|nr:phosphoadenosine phosphosulfate reductase family protein [Anaerospora hongkongensis]TCL40008.1 phosphoadenosine phosphosulfate reductase [Anaerospora hongkongensis]